MTTELEQEFFKVFEIEPKYQDACTVEDKYWQNEELANKYGTFDMYMNAKCGNQENCTTQCSCAYTKEIYPEITDKILLDLICLHNSSCRYAEDLYTPCELENVKEEFLEEIINIQKCPDEVYYYEGNEDFKYQVQQLFKGEE